MHIICVSVIGPSWLLFPKQYCYFLLFLQFAAIKVLQRHYFNNAIYLLDCIIYSIFCQLLWNFFTILTNHKKSLENRVYFLYRDYIKMLMGRVHARPITE